VGRRPRGPFAWTRYCRRRWRFFLGNLLPVTLGNVVGGAVLVGAVYWFVYLRPRRG
jgi:formate/nitrite transporter FocA (FNT family)